ncbi:MAG: hypothetical protein ACHQAY_14700 [Hyphomicrobiales bacterium]
MGRATARTGENFFIEDYVELLTELQARGVRFESLEAPDLASASACRTHYLKHDIHHEMVNTVRIAEAEHRLGVRSTFFMMHECVINRKYFAHRDTWKSLLRMRDMGHAIGLHIDGFDLIERYGDLRHGVEEALAIFAKNGLDIHLANTHGNSQYQTKFNFETVNFFKELVRPTECSDAFWMAHYARYSIADLGFDLWADTALWTPKTGEFLLDHFVSDNNQSLCGGRMRLSHWEVQGEKWELSASLRARLVDLVSTGSCIYLIHPQFFRPRSGQPI